MFTHFPKDNYSCPCSIWRQPFRQDYAKNRFIILWLSLNEEGTRLITRNYGLSLVQCTLYFCNCWAWICRFPELPFTKRRLLIMPFIIMTTRLSHVLKEQLDARMFWSHCWQLTLENKNVLFKHLSAVSNSGSVYYVHEKKKKPMHSIYT